MPHGIGLRILVIEDDKIFGEAIQTKLRSVEKMFSGAIFILVKTLAAARVVLSEAPYPDVAILDLTLEDSGFEQTLSAYSELEEKCPILIVSGHDPKRIVQELKGKEVPILSKDPSMWGSNVILDALISVMDLWHKNRFKDITENLRTLKEMRNAHGFK